MTVVWTAAHTAAFVAAYAVLVAFTVRAAGLAMQPRGPRPTSHRRGRSSIELARRIPTQRDPRSRPGDREPTRHIQPAFRRTR